MPGNHDAFRCSWPKVLDEMRRIADDAGIHLLADGEACIFNGVRFIGATL